MELDYAIYDGPYGTWALMELDYAIHDGPYGTWALMELDYAIYDGLEMILKVTKMLKKHLYRHSTVQMMMIDESVIVSSVICLLLF